MSGITIPAALEIAAKALLVEQLRAESVRLHRDRNGVTCDEEPEPYEGSGPCWKQFDSDGSDDVTRRPADQWCDRCRERENLHLRWRETLAQLGKARRSLQRACARQWRSIAQPSQEAGRP